MRLQLPFQLVALSHLSLRDRWYFTGLPYWCFRCVPRSCCVRLLATHHLGVRSGLLHADTNTQEQG